MATATIPGFAGELVRPGDATFDQHREIWNAMVDRRPDLIARCTTSEDVAASLRHARQVATRAACPWRAVGWPRMATWRRRGLLGMQRPL